jgi:hypothetical protein
VPRPRVLVKQSKTAGNEQFEQIMTPNCHDLANALQTCAAGDSPMSISQTKHFAVAEVRHFGKMAFCLLKRERLSTKQKSKK